MKKEEQCWKSLEFALYLQCFREVISTFEKSKYPIRKTWYYEVAEKHCETIVKTKVKLMKKEAKCWESLKLVLHLQCFREVISTFEKKQVFH